MPLLILRIGRNLFASHKDINNPNYNPNLPRGVNALGGIEKLVGSTVGRNMWAIMKAFNKLPNDPLIQSLTFAQREFIIASMNRDIKEAKAAAEGKEITEIVEDKSFESKYYAEEDVDLLEKGDNLDDIYSQVKAITKDEDYDKKLDKRLNNAIYEKKLEEKNVKDTVEDNWNKIMQDLKNNNK